MASVFLWPEWLREVVFAGDVIGIKVRLPVIFVF